MDPLSGIANVVALLGVAAQSCVYLVSVIRKLKDAPVEVAQAEVWLWALQSTFSELHTLVSHPRFVDVQAQLPPGFPARTADCRTDLLEIETRLRRSTKSLRRENGRVQQIWARVKYTFAGEQWLVQVARRLQMYQSAFTVDLVTIQMSVIRSLLIDRSEETPLTCQTVNSLFTIIPALPKHGRLPKRSWNLPTTMKRREFQQTGAGPSSLLFTTSLSRFELTCGILS
jgi:hypothetical protein